MSLSSEGQVAQNIHGTRQDRGSVLDPFELSLVIDSQTASSHQAELRFPEVDQLPYHIVPAHPYYNNDSAIVDKNVIEYQLLTPYVPVLNHDSPFSKCANLPPASQILHPCSRLQNTSTCFPNFATAEEYMRCSIPQTSQFSATIPTDPESHRRLVAVLSQAVQSTVLAQDKPAFIHHFNTSCYDPRVVEYHCWKLLYALMDRVRSGVPVANRYSAAAGKSKSRSRSKYQYNEFRELFDATRDALQRKKSLCTQIMDSSPILRLADDPLGRMSKSIENQHVNDEKRKDIEAGKSAREIIGDVDPKKRRSRKRAYTNDDGDHRGSSSTGSSSDRSCTFTDGDKESKNGTSPSFDEQPPQKRINLGAKTDVDTLSNYRMTAIETPSYASHQPEAYPNSLNTTPHLSNRASPGYSERRPSWASSVSGSINYVAGSQPTSDLDCTLPNISKLRLNTNNIHNGQRTYSEQDFFYDQWQSQLPPLPDLELQDANLPCLPAPMPDANDVDFCQFADNSLVDDDFFHQLEMHFP